jgi:hypothetical protein
MVESYIFGPLINFSTLQIKKVKAVTGFLQKFGFLEKKLQKNNLANVWFTRLGAVFTTLHFLRTLRMAPVS